MMIPEVFFSGRGDPSMEKNIYKGDFVIYNTVELPCD